MVGGFDDGLDGINVWVLWFWMIYLGVLKEGV